MTIDVFSTCYNEEVILPYFIKHYKQFARNIVVYNNMSTDNSEHIMKNAGVTLVNYDTGGRFVENLLVQWRNNCWKACDADWVIVCDMDELVYHPNIVDFLSKTDATHFHPNGYEMMSETPPTGSGQIYEEIKFGYPTDDFVSYGVYPGWKSNYSKGCLFKPSQLTDINFGLGSHQCNPQGNVISKRDPELKLLHYKYLGRQYMIDKYRTLIPRARAGNTHYEGWGADEINKQYNAWIPICKNVID